MEINIIVVSRGGRREEGGGRGDSKVGDKVAMGEGLWWEVGGAVACSCPIFIAAVSKVG